MGVDVKTYTYDGDTPAAARRAVRQVGEYHVPTGEAIAAGDSTVLAYHASYRGALAAPSVFCTHPST